MLRTTLLDPTKGGAFGNHVIRLLRVWGRWPQRVEVRALALPFSSSDGAVIIIFGAAVRPDGSPTPTLSRRVAAALVFGERLPPPPRYLPTGGIGRHGPSEASVMGRLLREAGVPDDRIQLEQTATDTLSSVRLCAALLRDHDGPVFAATSAYHLPRCLLLLRLAGLPASAVPPPRESASRRPLRRWYWRLREVPALPWDMLLLLWLRLIDKIARKR